MKSYIAKHNISKSVHGAPTLYSLLLQRNPNMFTPIHREDNKKAVYRVFMTHPIEELWDPIVPEEWKDNLLLYKAWDLRPDPYDTYDPLTLVRTYFEKRKDSSYMNSLDVVVRRVREVTMSWAGVLYYMRFIYGRKEQVGKILLDIHENKIPEYPEDLSQEELTVFKKIIEEYYKEYGTGAYTREKKKVHRDTSALHKLWYNS